MVNAMIILVSIGTGLFKGNLNALIGRQYKNKELLDAAFSIQYSYVNLGAFIGSLLTGFLYLHAFKKGEVLGFRQCFFVAAIWCLVGMVWFVLNWKNLQGQGIKPFKYLTDENGKVVGANCEKADGTKVTVNTKKGVILTSGGYGANPKMVKEYDNYWGDDLTDHTLTTNVGTNTGDGIVMAQEIGAGTVGLDVVQLMPSSSPIKGTMTDGIWGDASQQIWIDGEGNRFVNEYAERDVLAKASLALDNGIFYIIYAGKDVNENGELQGATLEDGLFGTTVQSMVDNGHVWYGSTLKELAENSKTSAGGAAPAFSEEALRATIEKYNTYVANQKDDDFGKEVLAGAIDIDAIENNPDAGFVISPRKASIHHTMGGVQINTNAEVLYESGNAIDGLWAAGEVTGGIHAGNRLGGNAVADIFTFGHIAGASAAQ